MKLIIAGSRSINLSVREMNEIIKKCEFPDKIEEIVSGGAIGVDKCGEMYAKEHNIPVKKFIPAWTKLETKEPCHVKTNKYGEKYNSVAGHNRNLKMAKYADTLLLIWDGKSTGSQNMLDNMEKLCKNVYKVIINP